MIFFTLILSGVAATADIAIAPDQPIPIVYCDDPLVIEISSAVGGEVSGTITVSSAYPTIKKEVAIVPFTLTANSPYWYVMRDAPAERGYYSAEVKLTLGSEEHTHRANFCRIDRLSSLQSLPIYVHCSGGLDTCSMLAARSVGIETIQIPASSADLPTLMTSLVQFRLHSILSFSASQLPELAKTIRPTLQAGCDSVIRIELDVQNFADEPATLSDGFRQLECPASVSWIVSSPINAINVLAKPLKISTRNISIVTNQWPTVDSIVALRVIGAQYGIEGALIHVACPDWHPRSNDPAYTFISRFLKYRAAGATSVGLNASVIADDVGVHETMAYLNGLARVYKGQPFVGHFFPNESPNALVFMNGSSWLTALWSDRGDETVTLPMEGAINLALYDAFGNPVDLPSWNGKDLPLTVGKRPLYIVGMGGPLPGRAATNQLVRQARFFLAQAELKQSLPTNAIELVQRLEAEPKSSANRLRFLEVLRVIPLLEEQWHTKQLPRHIAAPAIMQFAEMARTMAIIEEDRGELFLELLTTMLGRAEEAQSLYLTGSAGTAKTRERGDWILNEVRRLMDEAELLERSERKIEAVAVASIAEARSQCLNFAAQAESGEESATLLTVPTISDTSQGEEIVTNLPGGARTTAGIVEAATAGTEEEIIHVVVSGDNPYSIAKKYKVKLDDLLKWNNLTRTSILHIGQEIRVKKAKP